MGSTLIPWIFICFNFLALHISGDSNAPNLVESKRTHEWRANSLSKYELTREDPYHPDSNEFKRTKNNEQLRADEKFFKNEIRNPDELETNEERLRKHFYNSRHRSKNDAIRDNEITETKKSFKWIPKADEIKYNIWKFLERNITKDNPKQYGDLDYKQSMKNERKSQPIKEPANNSTYVKGFDLPKFDNNSKSRSNKIFALQQNKRSFWLDILNATVNGTGSYGPKRFKRAAHNAKKNKKNAKKDNKKPKKIPKSEWYKYIRGGKKEERDKKTGNGVKNERNVVKQMRKETGKNKRKEARGDTKNMKNNRNKSAKKEDKKNKESEKRKWEKMLNKGQGSSNTKGNSKKMAKANTKKQAKESRRNGVKQKRKVKEDVKDEKEGKKGEREDERKINKKPNKVLYKKNRSGKGDRSVATKKTAKKENKVSQKMQKAEKVTKNARNAPTSKKEERGKKKKEPMKQMPNKKKKKKN